MKIAVIVPVYRQWDLIPNLISTFKKMTVSDRRVEFILVDNEPGTDKNVPGINLVECQKPGSYAARNAGIRNSSADLFLFSDADCIPSAKWIESIRLAYKESNKKTLLAGNVIIRSNNTHPTTAELYDIAAGLPQERYVSRGYAVTANLAIPRAVFDEIGLFDETRFSGGDADFCQRALKAGFKLKFVPEAIVYHPARTTWKEYATKVRRMKGGQIRAGKWSRRLKYFLITLVPPVWRIWRSAKSDKLKPFEKVRVGWFQLRLWFVELFEMIALLLGKTPERR
ncbi:glycosyltransferase [Methylophaga sp.]|uniref:glycosyltransferase family 2 protein n=1 Tax=Methylophaga sp. TaxID=2024840 RepID=UPI001400CC38|nr:glycosyltransferase [Methylophaga sp.]MTI64686.1 glycosyltransferase [Methylophaga sp.]